MNLCGTKHEQKQRRSPCWGPWGSGTCPRPACGRCRWRSGGFPRRSPCSGWSGWRTRWVWTAGCPGWRDEQSPSRGTETRTCPTQPCRRQLKLWQTELFVLFVSIKVTEPDRMCSHGWLIGLHHSQKKTKHSTVHLKHYDSNLGFLFVPLEGACVPPSSHTVYLSVRIAVWQ